MSEPYWVPLGAAGIVPQGALVTALPGSPVDGQEVVLTDSLTAPTYAWQLRYVAAKASNRWIFLGGSPLLALLVTKQVCTSTSYVDLGTVGPSITLPLPGVWAVTVSGRLTPGSGADTSLGMSFAIGATAASDDHAFFGLAAASGVAVNVAAERTTQIVVAAVTALVAKYRIITAGHQVNIEDREIRALPVAVGG